MWSSGAEYSPAPMENRQRVLRAVARWTQWPFDRGAALKYGWLAAELKRTGRAMQQFDIAIAAIAPVLIAGAAGAAATAAAVAIPATPGVWMTVICGAAVSSKRFFQAPIVEPSYNAGSRNVVGPPAGQDAVRPICEPGFGGLPTAKPSSTVSSKAGVKSS